MPWPSRGVHVVLVLRSCYQILMAENECGELVIRDLVPRDGMLRSSLCLYIFWCCYKVRFHQRTDHIKISQTRDQKTLAKGTCRIL